MKPDQLDWASHTDVCEEHYDANLANPRPGAADCICHVDSGDPADGPLASDDQRLGREEDR